MDNGYKAEPTMFKILMITLYWTALEVCQLRSKKRCQQLRSLIYNY